MKKNCKYVYNKVRYFVKVLKKNSSPYVYVNLTGGLMFSLSLRFRLGDELLHMRCSFRVVVAFPNGLI